MSELTLLGPGPSPDSSIVVDDEVTLDQGFVDTRIVELVQLGKGDDARKGT